MIDWPRVNELKDEIGQDDFGEVVELFLEEVEEIIKKLRDDDRSQLEQDLHFLKGCALNLGFDSFSKLCLQGERQAAEGQASEVDLPAILDMFEASKHSFLTELPNQG
ncbi:Hpt domain-containing protein [Pseudophaeobacter sp.]|jgi:HPt (histidine-containing phosphotransfer) domain-containing protein|uniref:Hpt domain-containing protein n=1 Tax=unclassified Pseudophaeobacter TaxID=2637024 RepID=UPI0021FC46E3|nr:Hpt domain-containing protein [Pseudophaeobacter sp.]UWS79576.1 Hpt domain-containing protein [Phaeobacter sp. G2]